MLAWIAAEEAKERARIAEKAAKIEAEKDVEMARMASIAEQAGELRDLKQTELESD